MEFSEKDAARSKRRMTQRNSRGRGRGAAGPGRGGRGGRGGGAAAARDLGSNADRYYDEAAEEAAAAAALGPVQQSQGADLAELLSRAEPFDRGFYHRARVNLAQELGLPPEPAAGAYQGLTFDLKGLATCLELLPKNLVLETDAFSEEGDDEEGRGTDGTGDWAEEDAEQLLPDLDEPEWQAAAAAGASRQQAGAGGGGAPSPAAQAPGAAACWAQQTAPPPALAATVAPAAAASQRASGIAPAQVPAPAVAIAACPPPRPQPAAQPAAAVGGRDEGVDDLLSELLGEKATVGSSSSGDGGSTAATGRAEAAAPVAVELQRQQAPQVPTALSRPSQQQQAPLPLPQQRSVPQPPAEEHDDELDMLLGLSAGQAGADGKPAAGGSRRAGPAAARPATAPLAQQEGQSLEDWLDNL